MNFMYIYNMVLEVTEQDHVFYKINLPEFW